MTETPVYNMTADEVAAICLPNRYRYFLLDRDGTFHSRNAYGKATPWAFVQRDAAMNHLRRTPGCYVFDRKELTRITTEEK